MLQKPEKLQWLSRRQVLKVFGVGIGTMAIGAVSGCTTRLFDPSSSNRFVPLATSTTNPFWRTTQANKNLDREYLRERGKRLKRIAKQLKKGEGDPAKLASESRQPSYEIINHWTERGLLRALDEDLNELLTTDPASLVLPTPQMKAQAKRLQHELGLDAEDLLRWEEQIKWDNAKLLRAIQQEGSERLWRKWFMKYWGVPNGSSNFTPLGCPTCIIILLEVLFILITYSEPADVNGECVPSPCPGIIPTPPSNGGGCFVQGTLVATAKGPKPIQEIHIGDGIYAFNPSTKNIAVQKVVEIFKARGEEIFLLDFGTEEIRCTPLHRFYTERWVYAKDLSRGDRVLSLDGQWKELKAIKREINPQPVFNLHLDEVHNYFVGQAGLLVSKMVSKTSNL